jgi:hypothetical protein
MRITGTGAGGAMVAGIQKMPGNVTDGELAAAR